MTSHRGHPAALLARSNNPIKGYGYAKLADLWWLALQGATGLSGGEWSASWQDTRSSKVIYLLKRLGKIGAVPPKQPHDMDDEQWRQLVVSPAAAMSDATLHNQDLALSMVLPHVQNSKIKTILQFSHQESGPPASRAPCSPAGHQQGKFQSR